MSRIEVNELSLLKKGGVGRPPRRKNVLRKRAVMALPVGSNRHEGSWQFRPQLLSAIRHLEKEKKICHMKRNLDVLMVLPAPALSFTQCAKVSKMASYTVFFPIEPAGSSFFGGFKIRVILE